MSNLPSDSIDVASLRAEQRRRWQSGERVCVEDYLNEYPALGSNPDGLLDLIYNEVLLREESGDQPISQEFISRFPAFEIELRDQFEVHEIINGRPDSTALSDLECEANSTFNLKQIDPQAGGACTDKQYVSEISIPANRYILCEEIARGGMGVIYRATDTAFGREIAIKVLQDRFESSLAAAHRFSNEARITGLLQHPSIPPAHDLGILPDGRQFLAMKLIQGGTFDVILDERPDPSHDQGRFVAVFEQVCQAIAYAHAHRVIHRDLKPANVMVGNFGEVQVMDWGLAKTQIDDKRLQTVAEEKDGTSDFAAPGDSDGSQTQVGSVLGTPAFMPPEQAKGAVEQVDERSDVFGLGAMLAVILTGMPPFQGGSPALTRLMSAEGKLDDCFARLDKCGADPGLVTLCKNCLTPDKGSRPAHAGVVAKAVAELRVAADERARRAELDRVAAESERAAAVLTAAEQRKKRKAQIILAAMGVLVLASLGSFLWYSDRQAAVRRAESENRKRDGQELLDRCEESIRANNAAKALMAFETARNLFKESGNEDLAKRKQLLRTELMLLMALDNADEFRWTQVDNKPPAPKTVTHRFHDILSKFGMNPDTVPPEVVSEKITNSALRPRLIDALDRVLGSEKSTQFRTTLKIVDPDTYRDAVRDAILGNDQMKLRHLIQQQEAVDQSPGFVSILSQQSIIPVEQRRDYLEKAIVRHPGDVSLLMSLGYTYPIIRRDGAAERVHWFQAALAVNPTNVWAHSSLGLALIDSGDYVRAEAVCRETLKLAPTNELFHHNLGWALHEMGKLSEAEKEYEEAIRLDSNFALPHNNLGMLLERKGDLVAAERKYREAMRLNPQLAIPHYSLAQLALMQNDLQLAESQYREAVQLDPTFIFAQNGLGWVLEKDGNLDDAESAFREALKHNPKYAEAHCYLGRVLLRKGDRDGAEGELRFAILYDPKIAEAHFQLGLLHRIKMDLSGAEVEYREAIRLNPKDHAYRYNLGYLYHHFTGDLDKAITEYREALLIAPNFSLAAQNLSQAMRTQPLLIQLPDVIAGKSTLATPRERCDFALLCSEVYIKRYSTAVRFYELAFSADPLLASNLSSGHRYRAATTAAAAARGEGVDAPIDAIARTALRIKALDWLRADLVLREKKAHSKDMTDRKSAADSLLYWMRDPKFSELREGQSRKDIPDEEIAQWDALWREVLLTISEAQKPPTSLEIAPFPRLLKKIVD